MPLHTTVGKVVRQSFIRCINGKFPADIAPFMRPTSPAVNARKLITAGAHMKHIKEIRRNTYSCTPCPLWLKKIFTAGPVHERHRPGQLRFPPEFAAARRGPG
jgi:hypothetical protein